MVRLVLSWLGPEAAAELFCCFHADPALLVHLTDSYNLPWARAPLLPGATDRQRQRWARLRA